MPTLSETHFPLSKKVRLLKKKCVGERERTARRLLVLQLGLALEAKEPQCTACCPVNIFILSVSNRQSDQLRTESYNPVIISMKSVCTSVALLSRLFCLSLSLARSRHSPPWCRNVHRVATDTDSV